MFELDQRGVKLSAVLGLACGLVLAWVFWSEAPPPREERAPRKLSEIRAEVAADEARARARQAPTAFAANTAMDEGMDDLDQPGELPLVGQPEPAAPVAAAPRSGRPRIPVAELDLNAAKAIDGRLVQKLPGDRKIEYTIIPEVQERAEFLMQKADLPYGSVVAIEPSTGRVLAYAHHSEREPDIAHLPGKANPPAASVFKVITAAALLEHARISPDHETCYRGGSGGLRERHLKNDPRRDTQCATLTQALGKSTNAVFGKLADQKLDAGVLARYARNFGFNQEIPFIFPVDASPADFPTDRLTFAQVSAGFYHTHLSPMHGALIAASVANGGVMVAPRIVNRYFEGPVPVVEHQTTPLRRVIQAKTARVLANMMVSTTETGTAGPYFRNRAKILKGIRVAGKTGTLSADGEDGTSHKFSWFIGFAPAENPRIAVAALAVNIGGWRVKGSYLARETFEAYFDAIHESDISQATTDAATRAH